jgi:hypothetical protein
MGSDQIRSDQIRSDQIRSDQIRSDQIRSDQIPFSLLLHVGTLHCNGAETVSESGSGCICASTAL